MPETDREDRRVQEVMELTSAMMNRYYHSNDVEFVIAQMDEDIVWLGTAEHEFAVGREIVSGIFRRFAGQVPKCNISEEEYHVLRMGPDAYLCSGRMWIVTDASTGIRPCLKNKSCTRNQVMRSYEHETI
ncbi:nuclear transport factor 2 family protein [Intestinimonas timonensis]|uniref:nuclear transport factor 2 family protein n=1 Tax=Intestinimonas timonensis TaxID=1689270 RepID=UPI00102F8809|nr:nuclear transport factor 2 family protein [Intestinimonas timonensis]